MGWRIVIASTGSRTNTITCNFIMEIHCAKAEQKFVICDHLIFSASDRLIFSKRNHFISFLADFQITLGSGKAWCNCSFNASVDSVLAAVLRR